MSTPTGGAIAIVKIGTLTLPGMDWKLEIDPKLKDISNFLDGRKKIKTLQDGKFTSKIIWDQDEVPTDPAGMNLVDGASVTVHAFVDATRFFVIAGLVAKLTPGSAMEDALTMDIEVDLSGASIIYPVLP